MADQLVFARILADAEEQHRIVLDHHRQRVQAWFDELTDNHKRQLIEMIAAFEWDTHAALSAAAGDWRSSHGINGK